MNKVFSFGVDEDCSFFGDVFGSVEEYFNEVGKNFSSVFLDEFDCVVVRDGEYDGCIGRNEMWKGLDWDDSGEEEFNKFEKFVRDVEKEVEGKSVVVLSFCLESDDSWLVMNKNEYEKFMELVRKNEEMV